MRPQTALANVCVCVLVALSVAGAGTHSIPSLNFDHDTVHGVATGSQPVTLSIANTTGSDVGFDSVTILPQGFPLVLGYKRLHPGTSGWHVLAKGDSSSDILGGGSHESDITVGAGDSLVMTDFAVDMCFCLVKRQVNATPTAAEYTVSAVFHVGAQSDTVTFFVDQIPTSVRLSPAALTPPSGASSCVTSSMLFDIAGRYQGREASRGAAGFRVLRGDKALLLPGLAH
jgi:hypothetical protein